MKPCPFCGLVDDHDDKCYFTLKAAGAMSGDLARAWNRRASSNSPEFEGISGTAPAAGTEKDAIDLLMRIHRNPENVAHDSLLRDDLRKFAAAIAAHTKASK